jgi:cytochrome c-type biogenesis protein CcmI
MVIFGSLILVAVTVFVILQPVLAGKEAPSLSGVDEPSEAQFRKRISLLQLRDAEYEYAMGKLGDEDYQALRNEISAEALAAIRAEEAEEAGESPEDAALEAEIAAIRSKLGGRVFCSSCGHPNPEGSRFCGECGVQIHVGDPAPA